MISSASCGGTVKTHYPELFSDDPELAARIARLSLCLHELTDFLLSVLKLEKLPCG